MIDPSIIQSIAKTICDGEHIAIPTIKLSTTGNTYRDGTFHPATYSILLAFSSLLRGDHYFTALVVHEVCHAVMNKRGLYREQHGPTFKACEQKWLLHYSLVPVYGKAYWKALFCLKTGKYVYTRKG